MRYRFTKMQGCGNDYVYMDCFTQAVRDPSELARQMSDRHFGVGSDGLILVCPPTDSGADFRMRMFNADGSEGRMCGNGVRCAAVFARRCGIITGNEAVVQTLAGSKRLTLGQMTATVVRYVCRWVSLLFCPRTCLLCAQKKTGFIAGFRWERIFFLQHSFPWEVRIA